MPEDLTLGVWALEDEDNGKGAGNIGEENAKICERLKTNYVDMYARG